MTQVSPLTGDEVCELLGGRALQPGSSFERPTHAAVDQALGLVEESLTCKESPPDLDLSMTSFRRWLALL
jgi:hypothetical protein